MKKQDSTNRKVHLHLLNGFIDAMLTSGLGNTKENAIHVMSVTDEYILLKMIGFNFSSRSSQMPYDVFKLEENKYGIQELYFDVSVPFSTLNGLF